MTLVRPSPTMRQDAVVEQEQTLETTVILGQLEKLTTSMNAVDQKVTSVQRNQEYIRIELMGGVDEETKHGRLPRVEASVANHDLRIGSLETDHVKWKAYMAAAAGIGAVVGSLVAGLVGLVHGSAK